MKEGERDKEIEREEPKQGNVFGMGAKNNMFCQWTFYKVARPPGPCVSELVSRSRYL